MATPSRRRPRISPSARAVTAAHFALLRRLDETARALAAADVQLERRERVIERVQRELTAVRA